MSKLVDIEIIREFTQRIKGLFSQPYSPTDEFRRGVISACTKINSFLDTLPEENAVDLDEQIDAWWNSSGWREHNAGMDIDTSDVRDFALPLLRTRQERRWEMKAPDKIYMPHELLPEDWSQNIEDQDTCYIRKDALLEELKREINSVEKIPDDDYKRGKMLAYSQMKDIIESL